MTAHRQWRWCRSWGHDGGEWGGWSDWGGEGKGGECQPAVRDHPQMLPAVASSDWQLSADASSGVGNEGVVATGDHPQVPPAVDNCRGCTCIPCASPMVYWAFLAGVSHANQGTDFYTLSNTSKSSIFWHQKFKKVCRQIGKKTGETNNSCFLIYLVFKTLNIWNIIVQRRDNRGYLLTVFKCYIGNVNQLISVLQQELMGLNCNGGNQIRC